jgi:hypothetical protein
LTPDSFLTLNASFVLELIKSLSISLAIENTISKIFIYYRWWYAPLRVVGKPSPELRPFLCIGIEAGDPLLDEAVPP